MGTHTHIPTSDHRILPGGTAYQTDAGMCGDYTSVIGMNKEAALGRFTARRQAGLRSPKVRPRCVVSLSKVMRSPAFAASYRSGGRACCLRPEVSCGRLGNPTISCYFQPKSAKYSSKRSEIGIIMAGHSKFKNIMHRKVRRRKNGPRCSPG